MSADSFDERAATWDEDPGKHRRAAAVAEGVRSAVSLGPGTRLLEYGAGTGLVSQALQDEVGHVTVADASQGMLEVLRGKVASGALRDARVWDLDLSRDGVPDERFDLVVTVMTLHHIPELPPVLGGLANLLEEGGHLCAVDLEAEDGSFHGPEFPGHNGIARDKLTSLLTEAGFTDVRFRHCYRMEKDNRPYDLFLATAVRRAVTTADEVVDGAPPAR